jgi:glycosyltransferase involved in cell wall biosynthesis
MQPLVSIITPVYNRVNLLQETIESILSQTYKNWELLLIDDGSTDGSDIVAIEYEKKDNRIRFISRNREPKGANVCRNIGIEFSSGQFLIFLDSDDLLAENCIEDRVAKFQKYPDMDFLVFGTLLFNDKINDTNILWNIVEPDDYLLRFLRLEPPWSFPSVIWKSGVFNKCFKNDETILSFQDWDLHINALINGLNFIYFDGYDSYCRLPVSHNTIGKESTSIEHLFSHKYLFNKIKKNLIESRLKVDRRMVLSLSALFFWLINQYLIKGKRKEAIKLLLANFSFLITIESILIFIYILIYNRQGFNLFSIFFKKLMPDVYFNHFKYTFRNCNYEARLN